MQFQPFHRLLHYRMVCRDGSFHGILMAGVEAAHHPGRQFDASLGPDCLQGSEVVPDVAVQQLVAAQPKTGNGCRKQLIGKVGAVDCGLPGGVLDRRVRESGSSGGVANPAGCGLVAFQFGVELCPCGGTRGGKGQPQPPAQVRVHSQAPDPRGAVQQRPQQGVVAGAAPSGGGCRAGPDDLPVAAGLGGLQLFCHHTVELLTEPLAQGSRSVVLSGGLRIVQQHLQHSGTCFPGSNPLYQMHIVPGTEHSVSHRVPEGRQADCAGEGITQPVQRLDQGDQRVLVEADLGVRQVLVIEQEQRRTCPANKFRNLGPRSCHIHLDAVRTHQGAGVVEVVEADAQPVRAGHLFSADRVRCVLPHDNRTVLPGVVGFRFRNQDGHAGGLQPLPGPQGHVASGCCGQRGEQVRERRVAEGVVAEVAAGRFDERLETDVGHQLLQHGGALGVGDAVEVLFRRFEVGDVRHDRMGGGQLVLDVGPGLAPVCKADPGVGEVGGPVYGQGAHVVSERFLQPQIVPPLHGDQVAEPHMGHLVEDRVCPCLVLRFGCLGPEDVGLGERHKPGILHRTEVVFRDERLVVLAERVRVGEQVMEVVQPAFGHLENVLRVEVFGEGGTAICGQRHLQGGSVVERAGPVIIGPVVRTGQHCGDVGGDALCGCELPACQAAVQAGACGFDAVGGYLPSFRCGHGEGEGGLQVRLLEVGEHPPCICRFVLGVQIGASIGGVEETVQALSAAAVQGGSVHGDGVFRLQIRQMDPGSVYGLIEVQLFAVQDD